MARQQNSHVSRSPLWVRRAATMAEQPPASKMRTMLPSSLQASEPSARAAYCVPWVSPLVCLMRALVTASQPPLAPIQPTLFCVLDKKWMA